MVSRPSSAEDRIAQIHAAALDLFARKGYHQTSVDDIVAEVGLSKGTIYWYFESKLELFLSLFAQVMNRLMEAWRESIEAGGDSARDRVRAGLSFFASYTGEIVPLFGILIDVWAMGRQDETVVGALRDSLAPARSMIRELIDAGIESGEFQMRDPETMSFVLVSLVSGLIIRMGSGYWDLSWDDVLRAVEELITRGLGCRQDGADV